MTTYKVELYIPINVKCEEPDELFVVQSDDESALFATVIEHMNADDFVRTAYYITGINDDCPQWVLHTEDWQYVGVITPTEDGAA